MLYPHLSRCWCATHTFRFTCLHFTFHISHASCFTFHLVLIGTNIYQHVGHQNIFGTVIKGQKTDLVRRCFFLSYLRISCHISLPLFSREAIIRTSHLGLTFGTVLWRQSRSPPPWSCGVVRFKWPVSFRRGRWISFAVGQARLSAPDHWWPILIRFEESRQDAEDVWLVLKNDRTVWQFWSEFEVRLNYLHMAWHLKGEIWNWSCGQPVGPSFFKINLVRMV